MQWIAMSTMLIDHIGAYLDPSAWGWRVVGRLAFPIYAYLVVLGMDRTRDRAAYGGRLVLLAIAAQVPYILMDIDRHNVVFTLLAGVLLFWALEKYRGHWAGGLAVIALGAAVCELLQLEYGWYGLGLMAVYKYARGWGMVAAHAALTVMAVAVGAMSPVQLISIAATVGMVLWPTLDRLRAPVWLWRTFYPAHLALIAAVVLTLNKG